jgi:teichuronic acid biosynthesis glycosyltransferase TuaC
MSILFLSSVYPSPISPTKGTFNREMIAAIAKQTPVRVIVPIPWVDELQGRMRRGLRVSANREETFGNVTVSYPRFWYPPKVLRNRFDQFLSWSLRTNVRKLAANPPKAVLGYWAHPDGAVAVRIAKRLGVPGWIMVGGSDILLLSEDPGRKRVILKALHEADGIITVSEDIRRRIASMGIEESKIHLVRRGVDRSVFYPGDRSAAKKQLQIDESRTTFLWVGRLVDVKNIGLLIEAFAKVREKRDDWRLYLVGDGPLRASMTEKAQAAGLGEHIKFAGRVDHHDLANWYRAADWAVLSSRSEGVPNVLLEARACGAPFVSTRVGGVPEIALEGIDRMAPNGDAGAFGDAVLDVLSAGEVDSQALADATQDGAVVAKTMISLLTSAVPQLEARS